MTTWKKQSDGTYAPDGFGRWSYSIKHLGHSNWALFEDGEAISAGMSSLEKAKVWADKIVREAWENRNREDKIRRLKYAINENEKILAGEYVWFDSRGYMTLGGSISGPISEFSYGFGYFEDTYNGERQFHGACVEGEVWLTIDPEGNIVKNYRRKAWDDEEKKDVFTEYATSTEWCQALYIALSKKLSKYLVEIEQILEADRAKLLTLEGQPA
jgi:hypothetical protein